MIAPKSEKNLWTDKYMPNKFMDLLSDDKINREVLTWCKSWDEFVFKIKRVFYYFSTLFLWRNQQTLQCFLYQKHLRLIFKIKNLAQNKPIKMILI